MTYTTLLREAADYIDTHGWIKGKMESKNGQVCLTGAIRKCAPQPGDFHIVREVLRRRDRAEVWNDEPGRTQHDVTEYLRTAEVTDSDLEETFGPQWAHVVALIRRMAVLTKVEAEALYAAGSASSLDAAWSPARSAGGAVGGGNAGYAAGALSARHTIGTSDFTQAHYDLLTGPWRTVIGPIHPDDIELSDVSETGEQQ